MNDQVRMAHLFEGDGLQQVRWIANRIEMHFDSIEAAGKFHLDNVVNRKRTPLSTIGTAELRSPPEPAPMPPQYKGRIEVGSDSWLESTWIEAWRVHNMHADLKRQLASLTRERDASRSDHATDNAEFQRVIASLNEQRGDLEAKIVQLESTVASLNEDGTVTTVAQIAACGVTEDEFARFFKAYEEHDGSAWFSIRAGFAAINRSPSSPAVDAAREVDDCDPATFAELKHQLGRADAECRRLALRYVSIDAKLTARNIEINELKAELSRLAPPGAPERQAETKWGPNGEILEMSDADAAQAYRNLCRGNKVMLGLLGLHVTSWHDSAKRWEAHLAHRAPERQGGGEALVVTEAIRKAVGHAPCLIQPNRDRRYPTDCACWTCIATRELSGAKE